MAKENVGKGSIKVEWDEQTGKKVGSKIDEWSKGCDCKSSWKSGGGTASGGAVYGLGLIGALVYFIGAAGNFGEGVLGVLKAIVWPALLVFEALKFLGL